MDQLAAGSARKAAITSWGCGSVRIYLKGMPVTRCLYINGEIPFDEARSLTFTYDNQWQGTFLAINQEPCLFYLPAGSIEIRLEVTLGQAAPLIVRAQAQVDRLAAANRQLLTLLGTEPDLNRDYRIKEYMPEIPETFADVARQMDQLAEEWEAVAGDRDELLAQMDQMVFLLEKMANDPSLIPKNFTYFRDSLPIWPARSFTRSNSRCFWIAYT